MKNMHFFFVVLLAWWLLAAAQPDLSWLKEVEITPAPPIVEGTEVDFLAQFIVRGETIASLMVTGGIQGGEVLYERTFTQLSDGSSPRVHFRWTATAGDHTAYFLLQPTRPGRQGKYRTQVTFHVQPKPRERKQRRGTLLPDAAVNPVAAITSALQKPDIIITGVTCLPENPKAGESIELAIGVKNAGQADAPRSDVKVDLAVSTASSTWGASAETAFGVLPAQATAVVKTEPVKLVHLGLSPVGGYLKITVHADTSNRVVESLENNNDFSGEVFVKCRTDLLVYYTWGKTTSSSLFYKEISVKAGEKVIMGVKIHSYDRFNCGTPVTSPGKVVLKCTDYPDFVVPAAWVKRTNLNSQTEFDFSFVRAWSSPGKKMCHIHVDDDSQIDESKEFNNTGLFIVNVI